MASDASVKVKLYVKRHLPPATYDYFVAKRRAWHAAKQSSKWRHEQIAIALGSREPHLPPLERECFYAELQSCKTYLEYGSGGSTLAALKMVPKVISVENDRAFYRAITREARLSITGEYFPLFVNTGRTGEWGFPVTERLTALRIQLWRRYAVAPWLVIERNGLLPELIFIDGRFRVACALESLLRLPPVSDCRIMLDDFAQFDGAYSPIFEFAEGIETHGRAVKFKRARNLDQARCRTLLAQYYSDFR